MNDTIKEYLNSIEELGKLAIEGVEAGLIDTYQAARIAQENLKIMIMIDQLEITTGAETKRIKAIVARAENCLVCASIGNAFEVCENTIEILKEIDTNE